MLFLMDTWQVFWVFLVYIFILEKRKEKKNLEINHNIPLHVENSKIQTLKMY